MDPERLFELRMSFGMWRPNRHAILPDVHKLPEPLRRSAAVMQTAQSEDEMKAAANEFLTLSEEYVDSGRPDSQDSSKGQDLD